MNRKAVGNGAPPMEPNMHPTETQLNDYVDGALGSNDADRIRDHVTGCDKCAREAELLAALKSAVAALPLQVRPERDLRSDIWQRIERPRHTRTIWSARYMLAAAAVLLIAFSSLVTLAIVRSDSSTEIGRDYRNSARLVGRDSDALQRAYSEEVQELEMILRKSRGSLAPETVRIMEENLKIIDTAIREARSALEADPNSDMLVDLLRSAYERKLELLRQAAKSSPVT